MAGVGASVAAADLVMDVEEAQERGPVLVGKGLQDEARASVVQFDALGGHRRWAPHRSGSSCARFRVGRGGWPNNGRGRGTCGYSTGIFCF